MLPFSIVNPSRISALLPLPCARGSHPSAPQPSPRRRSQPCGHQHFLGLARPPISQPPAWGVRGREPARAAPVLVLISVPRMAKLLFKIPVSSYARLGLEVAWHFLSSPVFWVKRRKILCYNVDVAYIKKLFDLCSEHKCSAAKEALYSPSAGTVRLRLGEAGALRPGCEVGCSGFGSQRESLSLISLPRPFGSIVRQQRWVK